jgi:predicted MFS family arabinose efflux permease
VTVSARTFAVVSAGFCAFLALFAPQPLLPMLAAQFAASAAAVSLLITAPTLAVAIAAPFTGAIADRFGRKHVIVPAALLLAVPTILAGVSKTLGQLLFWRFLQGLLTPGIFAVTIAYITEEWEQGAGAAMSAYVTGTVLGGFCGRMIAGIVAGLASWRWAFFVLGALTAIGGAAIWLWLPPGQGAHPSHHRAPLWRSMGRHLRNRRLLSAYAVGFCVLFTLLGAFTYVNFYLAAPPFSLNATALGLLFVVYLVGAAITPVAGRWIDRLGHRVSLVAAFSAGIAGMSLALFPRLSAVAIGLALCCTSTFISHATASAYVGAVAKEARAAAVGLYVMFYYLGGTLGSALPGRFWSRGGWPACVALIVAAQVVTIAVALAFWQAPETAFPPTSATR